MMLVSHRRLTKDSSSSQLRKDLRLCRQHDTLNLETSQHPDREGVRSNTKIGPVLDAQLYPHEGRYCIDIMIESSFKDRTVSFVRIVNGINKHVTETSEQRDLWQ